MKTYDATNVLLVVLNASEQHIQVPVREPGVRVHEAEARLRHLPLIRRWLRVPGIKPSNNGSNERATPQMANSREKYCVGIGLVGEDGDISRPIANRVSVSQPSAETSSRNAGHFRGS